MKEIENLVRKNILSVNAYSSARDEYKGKDGVFLDANENPFGFLNRYPDAYQTSIKTNLSMMKKINSDHIFLGNGSDEVIDLAIRIFCQPCRDKIATFTPSYGMYKVSAEINDIENIEIPLNDQFQIDFNIFDKIIEDTSIKIIFVCSPNNPTGNSIEGIDYILNRFKGIVFVDEAYIDFSPHESYVAKISQYSNIIVSQTFSKSWGLAGARVGIAYSNPYIISLFNKVKPPYNVSIPNQNAVLEAISNIEEFHQNKNKILTAKKQLIAELIKCKWISKIFPSDANFILVETNNANKIYQALVLEKIIVRNRNSIVNNCLRITIGSHEENNKLISVLNNLEISV
ncbi:MAG: histidinol-phosphate transaminase [Bacteroidota bacterium]|jgi:histidinol-phosphate aminotransferase